MKKLIASAAPEDFSKLVDFKRIQTRPESFLDKMFIYLNTVRKTLM
jgi:hypothetical protein